MDPKRLRFSDLSSDSDSTGGSSHSATASSASSDYVLRLSTSFDSITSTSRPSGNTDRDSRDDFQFPLPVDAPPPSRSTDHTSRHSVVTVATGTTVWTAHGSTRTTMGIGIPPSTTGTIESNENTERFDPDALKLRRRTIGTISNNSCDTDNRAVTPTGSLISSSPTIRIQRKAISIADDTEELPPTQPSGPLKEVIAYVEVFSGADNRSAIIGNVLRDLGATLSRRLTNKVTHVVFRDGRQSTMEHARSRNIHLVSVLWVEACQRENERVSESDYTIARREKRTPFSVGRARRFRSMQPRPLEAEQALTDDCIRKRKQRLDASKQKRNVRKDIREGRIIGMSTTTVHLEGASAVETPAPGISNRAAVSFANAWHSHDDDETPESLRRQVADVRRKILGDADTPSSSRLSQGHNETFVGSVRKKLFDSGGKLRGTPVPTFLDRPKRSTRSTRSKTSETRSARPLREISSPDPGRYGSTSAAVDRENDDQRAYGSKIDEIVAVVCEKVRNIDLENDAVPASRRRIFIRESERISDGMFRTPESSAQDAANNALSLTARLASKNGPVEIDEVFGRKPLIEGEKGKRKAREGKKNEEVRLRSSLFQVKSSSDIVRQLQMGRRSSEEFQELLSAIGKSKRGKSTTRNRAPSKNAAVYQSPGSKRKLKSQGRRPTRYLVMTNVKQDDRELIYAIAKRMKGVRIQNKVTSVTTHVICGENRRTLTVLMGVARGCWMLPVEWVFHSLANGEWLREDQFELTDQFPAAKAIRKGRKIGASDIDIDFAPMCKIFSDVGPFFVSSSSQPPAMDLCSLIRWCGGKIALTSKRASFCVGCPATHEDAVGVKETWILDSIMEHRLVPIDGYMFR